MYSRHDMQNNHPFGWFLMIIRVFIEMPTTFAALFQIYIIVINLTIDVCSCQLLQSRYKRQILAPLLPSFLLVVLSVELTPGPNMGWLALLSASDGRRAGSAATAGIGPGLAMIAAASAFGLAQVAQQSQLVFGLARFFCFGWRGRPGLV